MTPYLVLESFFRQRLLRSMRLGWLMDAQNGPTVHRSGIAKAPALAPIGWSSH